MSTASLSSLYSQRTTVLNGMENSGQMISDAEEKIARLQKASGKMSTSLSELEATKSSIDNLIIDGGRWKGEKENKFENNYNEYKDSVKEFIAKTEDAKVAIEDDIKRYEADKAAYITGLKNLENSLDSLDTQISQVEKE